MEKNYIKANYNKAKRKKIFYIAGSAVIVALLSFAITVDVVSEDTKKKEDIAYNDKPFEENIPIIITADSSIKEIEKKEPEVEKEIVKEEIKKEEKKEIIKEVVQTVTKSTKKEVTFISPVEGEIVTEYAKDKLVYSKTLEEWITHNGIDIKAEEATPVKVSADGKIKDKKFDPRYGNTIIVEHENGYTSIYSNLTTIDLVTLKQEVKQGDIISGVGEGYGFESEEGAHIHFEIMKDGKHISPTFAS